MTKTQKMSYHINTIHNISKKQKCINIQKNCIFIHFYFNKKILNSYKIKFADIEFIGLEFLLFFKKV
jgi:hypothetical protein